jgi:ABC-2 type transport system permease protein
LRRLLISPLNPAAYFLGIVLALFVVAVVQSVIIYALAFAMGSRFHGDVMLGATIVALSIFAFVGLGGTRFAKRAEDVNGPVAAFGVPLLVLAGTWFPVQPATQLPAANRVVRSRANVSGSLLFLISFAAVSLLIGMASYRRMLMAEKHS